MELVKEYNKITNSFEKTVVYHVGVAAGFHSEVDAMMQCMLYCYVNKIKFILYADDANFAGGHGWNEFFESFCEECHDKMNHIANYRLPISWYRVDKKILAWLLKKKLGVDYLTYDIFDKCISRESSTNIQIEWPLFGIKGTNLSEFAKLNKIALKYNEKTQQEVQELIATVELPEKYVSIQFRGGDKSLEFSRLINTKEALARIRETNVKVSDIFVFNDDYRFVNEVKELRPEWKVYTLTREDEKGYVNKEFQKLPWKEKRKDMIKLFAMVEICLASDLHFGCEQACVNNYIRALKNDESYYPIWEG